MIKKLLAPSTDAKLSMLRQIQDSFFVSCVEVFHFEDALYVVSEHMTISLLQIVAAPLLND